MGGVSAEEAGAHTNLKRVRQARAAMAAYLPSPRVLVEGSAGVYQVTRSDDGCHVITDDGQLLTCCCGQAACCHMADLLLTGLLVSDQQVIG